MKKRVLILGGGGFIGGHLAKKLKSEGCWVRVVDIKKHEYFKEEDFCHEFILGDLRNPLTVSKAMFSPSQSSPNDAVGSFDEVYQLAADMGGAGYIFTGDHDADVMHNSALINLNVAHYAEKHKVKKIFYSSSACMYPEHNQLDPLNPNCEESSAYPANPDSEYGWEKLFSERLYGAFSRNYGMDVRIARFHNIFGPYGTWKGGKEKAPAAMCRKAAETEAGSSIEVWGDGQQTRSFLYIDDCLKAIEKFMESNFQGPVNIGSEEMVTINELAQMAIDLSGKDIKIDNIKGVEFLLKYGFNCPTGVRGRNSDNKLFEEKMKWKVNQPLKDGMAKTFNWIKNQLYMDKFCVVVQGPSTQVDEIRTAFGEAGIHVIFSTWEGQRDKYSDSDIVVFNEYPTDAGIGNINYQKITTLNGLMKAKQLGFDYALKFRSDQIPTNPKEFVKSFFNDRLNFFAWHFTPDLAIKGYMVDYFMSGPIDQLIDIWTFESIRYSIPEAMITNGILKNFEKFNFLVNVLDEDNDVYWDKYKIKLSNFKNIKTTTWFGEIDLRIEPVVHEAYKTVFE
jgi:nucleoside-diphosphate-sugar epimerase